FMALSATGTLTPGERTHFEEGITPSKAIDRAKTDVQRRFSDTLRANITQLDDAVGWHPDNLVIDRFGLNIDFIEEQNLTWIDNLQTSSQGAINDLADPRHKHHRFL